MWLYCRCRRLMNHLFVHDQTLTPALIYTCHHTSAEALLRELCCFRSRLFQQLCLQCGLHQVMMLWEAEAVWEQVQITTFQTNQTYYIFPKKKKNCSLEATVFENNSIKAQSDPDVVCLRTCFVWHLPPFSGLVYCPWAWWGRTLTWNWREPQSEIAFGDLVKERSIILSVFKQYDMQYHILLLEWWTSLSLLSLVQFHSWWL